LKLFKSRGFEMDPQIKSNTSILNPSLEFHSIQDKVEPISQPLAKSIDKIEQIGEGIIHTSNSDIAENPSVIQEFPPDIVNSYHSAKLQKDLLNELNGSNIDDLDDLDMDFDMDLIEEDNNSIEALQIADYQEDSQINEDSSLENIEKEYVSEINEDISKINEYVSEINLRINEKTDINENKESIETAVSSEIKKDMKLEVKEDQKTEITQANEARIDTVTLGEKVVIARLANVYLIDAASIKQIDPSKLIRLTDDLEKGDTALKTKKFIEIDIATKKAYVPRGSDIVEGTEIEVEGVKLTVSYMTEDQERSLLEDWNQHVMTTSTGPETKQEVQEKKPEETKPKDIKRGVDNDVPVKNGKDKEIAGGWVDKHSFALFTSNPDAAKVEHRKNEESGLEHDIKNEEDVKELRKKHIRNEAQTADSLKENVMKNFILLSKRDHNDLTAQHRMVMVPPRKAF